MSKKQRSGKGKQSNRPPASREAASEAVGSPASAVASPASVGPASVAPTSKAPASAAPDTVPATPRKRKVRKAKLDQKLDQIEQKLDQKAEAAAAARVGFASDPGADDTTVPPVVEDEFFAVGDAPPRPTSGMSGAFEAVPDARMERKMSKAASERRARYSRIVQGIFAAAVVLLGVGFAAKALRPKEDASVAPRAEPAAAAQPAAVVEPVQPAAQPVPEPPKADEPKAEAPKAEEPVAAEPKKDEPVAAAEPKKDEPVAAAEPKKDEPKKDEPAAPAAEAPKPTRTAAQEKAAAQAALDRNAVGAAVAAAKRSTELDPSDAEAWLILGAGHQMQGNAGAARAAFSSCVKQATKGPKGECQQMLQ